MIFQIHQMMLEDLDYCDSVTNIITSQGVNAEYAVGVTADNFAQMFSAMDDPYMQGRAADVKDVSERLVNVLCGVQSAGVDSAGRWSSRRTTSRRARRSSSTKTRFSRS